MNYSKMLKEILDSSHWTQEQLATKLGVSFATVNSWLNGRTKPQKSLVPDIKRLYLAQDITGELEPVYVTLVNVDDVRVGDYVLLEKDTDNDYDDEAILAVKLDESGKMEYREDDEPSDVDLDRLGDGELEGTDLDESGDEGWADKVEAIRVYMGESRSEGYSRPMHVANSVNTVVRGTRSAGRIYDKFDSKARAQVVFVMKNSAVARVVSWQA